MPDEYGGRSDWRIQRILGVVLVIAGIFEGLIKDDLPGAATFIGLGAAFLAVKLPIHALRDIRSDDDKREDPKP